MVWIGDKFVELFYLVGFYNDLVIFYLIDYIKFI